MDVTGITGLLKIISWKKIFQVTILILILGISYALWENRIMVYDSLKVGVRVEAKEPLILNLSSRTISILDESSVKMKQLIGGIQIINVDFKKNIRSTAYFAISNPILKNSYDSFLSSGITDIPLFTNIEINNQRIIDLINGEFICYDYKDTPAFRIFPQAAETITTVCSISIPPYYGRFSGYLDIYLLRKPSADDMALIRQIARDLSLHIYESDVDTSVKYNYEQR